MRISDWSSDVCSNDLLAIGNIRGLGAMLGFDILDRDTGQPNGAAARAVCARALEQGLLLLNCGVSGEAIRILVPLTAPDAVLDEGLDMLERALASDGGAARSEEHTSELQS